MTYDLAPEEPPSAPEDAPLLDEHMRPIRRQRSKVVEDDVPCIRCGYNLRALSTGGRCPECGAPIVISSGRSSLLDASPEWLRVVQRGLAMLLWSTVASIAGVLNGDTAFGGLLASVADVLALIGVLALTTREPRQRLARQSGAVAALRAAAVVLCGLSLLGVAGRLGGFNTTALSLLDGVAAVLHIAVIIGICWCLRRLAARLDDVTLEQHTVTVMWGLAGSSAAVAVFAPLNAVLGAQSKGPALCGTVVGVVAVVFFGLWFLRLLYRYHGVIKWVAHEARVRVDEEQGT